MGGCLAYRLCVASSVDNKFDGDEMNGYLALDEWMSGHLDKFAPHTSALDLGKPFTISKALTIPSPIITSISNWMYKGK